MLKVEFTALNPRTKQYQVCDSRIVKTLRDAELLAMAMNWYITKKEEI